MENPVEEKKLKGKAKSIKSESQSLRMDQGIYFLSEKEKGGGI
jgi:hypothetical protein